MGWKRRTWEINWRYSRMRRVFSKAEEYLTLKRVRRANLFLRKVLF